MKRRLNENEEDISSFQQKLAQTTSVSFVVVVVVVVVNF